MLTTLPDYRINTAAPLRASTVRVRFLSFAVRSNDTGALYGPLNSIGPEWLVGSSRKAMYQKWPKVVAGIRAQSAQTANCGMLAFFVLFQATLVGFSWATFNVPLGLLPIFRTPALRR